MPPEGIDSLDADSQKRLLLSLLAKIDELFEQNKDLFEQSKDLLEQNNSLQATIDELLKQISALLARIAELEARGGKPPKTSATPRIMGGMGEQIHYEC